MLQVWLIFVLGFRGFRVLIRNCYIFFVFSKSIWFTESEKTAFEFLKTMHKDSVKRKWTRVVSGIMEHLKEKIKLSPEFKIDLATLGISN